MKTNKSSNYKWRIKKSSSKRRDAFLTLGIMIVGFIILVGLSLAHNQPEVSSYDGTSESLIELTNSANAESKYCTIGLEVRIDNADGDMKEFHQYTIDKEFGTTDTKYEYKSKDGEIKKEYWRRIDEEIYDMYLYIDDIDSYLNVLSDFEPVQIRPWLMFSSSTEYDLTADSVWGTDNIPCYVLYTTGKNDKYDTVIESIYINKDTYKLEGIITQGYSGSAELEIELEEHTIHDEHSHNEEALITFVRYDFDWSNDSNREIDMPINIITEEEYNTLYNKNN